MKKKVLLSVLAAGLVLPSASVLARELTDQEKASVAGRQQGNVTAEDKAKNDQTEAVLAAKDAKQRAEVREEAGKKVIEYLEAHKADLLAEAAKDPAVVAAQAALDNFVKSGYAGHDYQEKKDALEKALADAKQNAYNKVYGAEFNRLLPIYIDQLVKAGFIGLDGSDKAKADAAKAAKEAKSGKAGNKALPKTSAVK